MQHSTLGDVYRQSPLSSGALAEAAYSALLTATKHGLNPLTYLEACAAHGGNAPADLDRFLPWTASPADRAAWVLPPTAA